ncbi:hypothetical protein HDV06_002584 [Boothiomyces sp. JEL0866]|nr:hypothetical protein HDV06_002584 [Boothiomyces sp. JEL0866]
MIQSPAEQIGLNLNDLTTTPNIEYKLMDDFLALKTPFLSPAIVEYLQNKDAIKDFMNRITLYRDHDFMYKENIGQDHTFSGEREIVKFERSRNQDLKESFVAMDLITRPKQTLKSIYTKELMDELFLILKPESKGSLFHFRKIFMTGLLYHPGLLYSLKDYIFLMVSQIVNQPIQDTIACCFTAIYTKQYLSKKDEIYVIFRDIQFLDYMFTKMVCDDLGIVRAFCSTLTRVLNILDIQECQIMVKEYELQETNERKEDQVCNESKGNENAQEREIGPAEAQTLVNHKQMIFDNVIKMIAMNDIEIKKEIIDFISNMNFAGQCQPIKSQIINSLSIQVEIITSLDLLKQNCSIYQSKLYKLIKKSPVSIRKEIPKVELNDGLFSRMIVELLEKDVENEEFERVNKIGLKGNNLVVDEV